LFSISALLAPIENNLHWVLDIAFDEIVIELAKDIMLRTWLLSGILP
jgi:hypothetical protein